MTNDEAEIEGLTDDNERLTVALSNLYWWVLGLPATQPQPVEHMEMARRLLGIDK